MDRSHAVRETRLGREVAEVERDDDLRFRDDRRRKHVAILRGVCQARLGLGDRCPINVRRIERGAHGRDQPVGVPARDPLRHEVASGFLEDARTPERLEQVPLGHAEQRVPQRERIEDAGIENDPEGHWAARIGPRPAG